MPQVFTDICLDKQFKGTNSCFCCLRFSTTKAEQPISSITKDIDTLLEELLEENDGNSSQTKVNTYLWHVPSLNAWKSTLLKEALQ